MRYLVLFALILGVSFTANAVEKIHVPSGHLLTHWQFKKLSKKQQVRYIVGLRRVFAKMYHKTEHFVENKQNPLLNILFNEAIAVENFPRCMYAGFVIRGTQKCNPKLTFSLADGTSMSCSPTNASGKPQALCNPLLFGTKADGKQFCVPRHPSATKNCREAAGNNAQATAELIHKNGSLWNNFTQDFTDLCAPDVPAKNRFDFLKNVTAYKNGGPRYERAVDDIGETCFQAQQRIDELTKSLNEIKEREAAELALAAASELRSRNGKIVCDGKCSIRYEFPNEYVFGAKTKDYKFFTSRGSASCSMKFSEDGKRLGLNIDNLRPKLSKIFKKSFDNIISYEPCNTGADCEGGNLQASNEKYEMQIKSPGENGKACEVVVTKKKERIIASLTKKLEKNKQQCMAGINNSDLEALYDKMSDLVADDACTIKRVDIKATEKSRFGYKKNSGRNSGITLEQSKGDCPVRMTQDLTGAKTARVEVTYVDGHTQDLEWDISTIKSKAIKAGFRKGNACFDSVKARTTFEALDKAGSKKVDAKGGK